MGDSTLEGIGVKQTEFQNPLSRTSPLWVGWVACTFLAAAVCLPLRIHAAPKPGDFVEKSPGVAHARDRIDTGPWALEVVRIDRARKELTFRPMLGLGDRIGLNRLTGQVRFVPKSTGRAVAAINGDFYKTEHEPFPGDPRGLFIANSEIFSAPSGGAVFWLETNGVPRIGALESGFEVTWADGEKSSLGFNEADSDSPAILFTRASSVPPLGRRGRLLVLEPAATNSGWTPFRIGQSVEARISADRRAGEAIEATRPLLWVANDVRSARYLKPGATLSLHFLSVPALQGVDTAIGGGPVLVRDGKVQRTNTNKSGERHPRSAMGWNATHFFLVVVDGRQSGYSVGMSLPELARYMRELGCEDAMNLDGGGSTELWMEGKILNRPCYGHERETATSLIVIRKPAETASPGADPAKRNPAGPVNP